MDNWLNVISHSSAVAKGSKPILGSFLTPTWYSLLIYPGITLLLCLALVQLLREHSIQLLYPQLKKDVEKLEIFQRRATRMTEGLKTCLTVEPISLAYQTASQEKLKSGFQVCYIRKRNSGTEAPSGNSLIRIGSQKLDEFILYISLQILTVETILGPKVRAVIYSVIGSRDRILFPSVTLWFMQGIHSEQPCCWHPFRRQT